MGARRFNILYKQTGERTEEREVAGTPDDALRAAWDMLQDGSAKVAAIVEIGNLEFQVWHRQIVTWGEQQQHPPKS
jgi:hypothetical protein